MKMKLCISRMMTRSIFSGFDVFLRGARSLREKGKTGRCLLACLESLTGECKNIYNLSDGRRRRRRRGFPLLHVILVEDGGLETAHLLVGQPCKLSEFWRRRHINVRQKWRTYVSTPRSPARGSRSSGRTVRPRARRRGRDTGWSTGGPAPRLPWSACRCPEPAFSPAGRRLQERERMLAFDSF